MTKKRKRHTPEQIVKKLRDAEAMKNAAKERGQRTRPKNSAKELALSR